MALGSSNRHVMRITVIAVLRVIDVVIGRFPDDHSL
jgi:hypothetical protein